MPDNEERRRNAVRLEPKYEDMITQMHTILTDENMGICKVVKDLHISVHGDDRVPGLRPRMDRLEPMVHKTHTAIYGNGWWGLKMQSILIWAAVALLGTDNIMVQKLVAKWWGR